MISGYGRIKVSVLSVRRFKVSVLSVRRFTDSEYHCGIFKLFLSRDRRVFELSEKRYEQLL